MTVAGGPLDDRQGRREPRVLEVRGRPRTPPGASGTGPTQRACGHGTLALDDVGCRLPTVRSVLASVEVGALCGPERGTAGREDSLHTFPA